MGGSKLNRQFNLKNAIFVLLIFVLSLSVRLIGIDYGKPLRVHPDEENVVHSALYYSPTQDLSQVTLNRPAQVQTLLSSITMRLYSMLVFKTNIWHVFHLNNFTFTVVSRLIVAVLGSLIPLLAYFIGKEFEPDFSKLAAILFAFFPSFVLHSHYATPDIPLTLWLMAVMLFSIRYAKGQKEHNIWLAVFFCAMSTADKYPGIITLFMVALAVFLRFLTKAKEDGKFNVSGFVLKGLLIFFVFIAFLFVVSPLLFFRVKDVIQALIFEATGGHLGREGLNYPRRLLKYLEYYVINAGLLISGFTLFGIVQIIKRKQKAAWIFSFSGLFLLCIAVISFHHERWALPVYVALLICAAYGMQSLLELVKTPVPALRFSQVLVASSLILLIIAGVSQSLWLNLRDTRLSGYHFLEVNEIRKEQCYYDGYTPFAPNFFPIDSDQDLSRKEEMDYAIFSSFYFRRFEHLDENEHDELRYLRKIEREGELIWSKIAEENPTTLARQWRLLKYYLKSEILKLETDHLYSGPNLYIYKLNPQIKR